MEGSHFFVGQGRKTEHSELYEDFLTQDRGKRASFMVKDFIPKALDSDLSKSFCLSNP